MLAAKPSLLESFLLVAVQEAIEDTIEHDERTSLIDNEYFMHLGEYKGRVEFSNRVLARLRDKGIRNEPMPIPQWHCTPYGRTTKGRRGGRLDYTPPWEEEETNG